MTDDSVPMTSPMPGEMEGNEPPEAPDAPDQIPFPDVDEEV